MTCLHTLYFRVLDRALDGVWTFLARKVLPAIDDNLYEFEITS